MIFPVLNLQQGIDGFGVYCDNSRVGLWCMLMQYGKVKVYDSRKLKTHENNYPSHNLEHAAVFFGLKYGDVISMVTY